ncbi:hypothetical protein DN614_15110 [Klebsiella michiganensis]|nr:hypothetical protein DN614_15110 [Klebsiella michiganensis]
MRGGDIRIKTGGMQLYALFPARRQTIDEKVVNLPDAKKMRYLSHFCLFIIAGFMGENRQPTRAIIASSNLMILKKIKR